MQKWTVRYDWNLKKFLSFFMSCVGYFSFGWIIYSFILYAPLLNKQGILTSHDMTVIGGAIWFAYGLFMIPLSWIYTANKLIPSRRTRELLSVSLVIILTISAFILVTLDDAGFWVYLIAYALKGAAFGGISNVGGDTISSNYKMFPVQKSMCRTMIELMMSLGGLIGSMVTPMLLEIFELRLIFAIQGVITVLVLILGAVFIRHVDDTGTSTGSATTTRNAVIPAGGVFNSFNIPRPVSPRASSSRINNTLWLNMEQNADAYMPQCNGSPSKGSRKKMQNSNILQDLRSVFAEPKAHLLVLMCSVVTSAVFTYYNSIGTISMAYIQAYSLIPLDNETAIYKMYEKMVFETNLIIMVMNLAMRILYLFLAWMKLSQQAIYICISLWLVIGPVLCVILPSEFSLYISTALVACGMASCCVYASTLIEICFPKSLEFSKSVAFHQIINGTSIVLFGIIFAAVLENLDLVFTPYQRFNTMMLIFGLSGCFGVITSLKLFSLLRYERKLEIRKTLKRAGSRSFLLIQSSYRRVWSVSVGVAPGTKTEAGNMSGKKQSVFRRPSAIDCGGL